MDGFAPLSRASSERLSPAPGRPEGTDSMTISRCRAGTRQGRPYSSTHNNRLGVSCPIFFDDQAVNDQGPPRTEEDRQRKGFNTDSTIGNVLTRRRMRAVTDLNGAPFPTSREFPPIRPQEEARAVHARAP